MKLSRILLTVLAGAALVMLAKSIRKKEAADDDFHDAYPDPAPGYDDGFRHFYPDNPVHAQDDTDHPMFV